MMSNIFHTALDMCTPIIAHTACAPAAFGYGTNTGREQFADGQAEEVGHLPDIFKAHAAVLIEKLANPGRLVPAKECEVAIVNAPMPQ